MSETDTLVSHEQDGRILEGIGADVDTLQETMERHAPKEPEAAPAPAPTPEPAAPTAARGEHGHFASPSDDDLLFPDGTRQKPQRGQKRFQQLTAHREAWQRHAETAQKERDDYKRQVDELRARPAEGERRLPPSPSAAPAAAPASPQTKVTYPEHLKTYEAYIGKDATATYEDYIDARADFRVGTRTPVDLDARIQERLEAERASRTFTEKVSSVLETGRKAYPDFEAVRATSDVMFPQPVLDLILGLDNAAHVIYQLAKDRALSEKIATSNPYQAGLELAKLVTPAAVVSPASTARTVVPPPAPYQPVAGGSKTSVPSSANLAASAGDDYDRSGYRESRARERGVRSRW